MTTTLLEKKVEQLERKVRDISYAINLSSHPPHRSAEGLAKLHGVWKKKPRTHKDLARVRKRLWKA